MHKVGLIVITGLTLTVSSCATGSKECKSPKASNSAVDEKALPQNESLAPPSSAPKYDRDADLEQLGWWLSMEHSLTPQIWIEAITIISKHRQNSTTFTDAEFFMEVKKIVSLVDNGHTNVSGTPIYERFGLVPLRMYWFSDGLYIVRAQEQYKHLLGTKVEGINGKSLSELETILLNYHGGSKAFFRRYDVNPMLLCPALLHAIGLSKSSEQLTFKVQNQAGKTLEVEVKTDTESKSQKARPWRHLHPAPIEEEEGWYSIHDVNWTPPLRFQQEDKLFRYVLIENGDVAYIQLRSNIGPEDNLIEDFAAKTTELLKRDRPHSIILDNRQNPGGDLTRTAEFALALPSMASPKGKVYVLTGSGTFSAGIYTSFFPKAADPDRTVIVGEHVGDRSRFWAETGPAFVLKDSGYRIGYSLQIHDLANGCKDPQLCCMARFPSHWNIAVGSLEPDWKIPTTFADFQAGHDEVLERVMKDATQNR